jgi:hypothetical protein
MLNPDNRKLAKKAMKGNHTWAKYAIAFGATVKHDPVAVKAMNEIGLTQASLAHKDSDVEKVREYLETLYPNDKQVLKSSPMLGEWVPKTVEPSARCLSAAQRRAEKLAQPKLKTPPPSTYARLLASLARADEMKPKYDTYRKQLGAAKVTLEMKLFFEEYQERINAVIVDLKSHAPVDESGVPHRAMREFLNDLADRAEVRQVLVVECIRKSEEMLTKPSA